MKKCSRCNTYFSDGQRDLICCFHVTPWIDVHTPGKGAARIGVWSCCKEVSRDAPGCMKGVHVEDKITTEHLRNFEVLAVKGTQKEALELLDTEFLQKNLGNTHVHYMDHSVTPLPSPQQQNNENGNGKQKRTTKNYDSYDSYESDDDEEEEDDGFIHHTVQLTDTLPGIAIRYHTSVAKLKQINKLYANTDLFKLKTLLVPDPSRPVSLPSPSPLPTSSSVSSSVQIRRVSKLALVENICREEALFYLSDNNWDFTQARASFTDDVEWATAEWARLHKKGRFREWLGDSDVQTVAVVACGALIVLLCVLL